MSVIFLPKIHKLIFFIKKDQTNTNEGYTKKLLSVILKKFQSQYRLRIPDEVRLKDCDNEVQCMILKKFFYYEGHY